MADIVSGQDVDVISHIPGTGATNLGKAEDDVHNSGDVGVMALAVRKDNSAAFAADGDYVPLQVTASGYLRVNVENNAIGYERDSVPSSTDTVQLAGVYRKDTAASLVGTDGDRSLLQVDATGSLRVGIHDGTTMATVFDYTNSNPIAVRLTDTAGDYIAAGAGTQYTEDAAAAGNPIGTALIAVRADTLGAVTDTDGDNIAARATNKGELYVKHVDSIPAGTNNIGDVDVVSTVHATNRTASGTLGALNATLAISGEGAGSVFYEIDSGLSGSTITTQATLDDTNWFNIANVASTGLTGNGSISSVPARGWIAGGWSQVRLIVSIYGSGSSAARLEASSASNSVYFSGALPAGVNSIGDIGTVSTVTNVATIGTSVTPGTGTSNLGKAEDQASANAHVGVGALAVRKATPANTSDTDGDYEFLQISAGRLWASATIDAALPAGSNAIGKLAANSGVDIGDIDVTSVVPGTGATNLGKAEDDVHNSADVGVMALAVRKDTASAVAADGDYIPLIVDSTGKLHCNVGNTVTVSATNLSTNIAQMNGTTVSMGAGATGTGVQRVVQADGTGRTLLSAGGSASSSGNNTLVAAGTNRLKVYAFSLSTTSTTAVTCIFQSGAGGTELWRVVLQAPTSVSTGANLAVSPPAWLFATASATLLNLNLSSAQTVHWSVSYYDEA